MTTLHTDELHHIANLAKLKIKDSEMQVIGDKLSKVITMIEQMNKVDTRHVKPLIHPLETTQPLREDTVTETNEREQLQALAPLAKHRLYLVPQVIETEE